MRTFMLAVTGLVIAVAACSSYGTSVVEVGKTRAQVASVSLTIPSSLLAGQTARAVATPKDANGAALTDRPVAWYTSSGSIASVNDSGVISAVAPGTAVVSTVSEGISGQARLAVMPPPPTPIATVAVAGTPPAVLIGQTAHATAILEDSSGNLLSGRIVTWASSNSSVATVDTAGTIKAIGSGNAMIKATSEGKTNSSSFSVSAPAAIPVASVSVSPASATLQVGGSAQLTATTSDANGNVLTGRVIGWSSSNTSIATVSSSGLVTAVAGGSVSITAASEGQTASAAITVSPPAPLPVASASVSPASSSLLIGATAQLSATTRDANNNVLTGRVITWSSLNAGVASVSSSGLVTAVAAGSATITATSETKTGTAAITVSAPAPVPVATVTVSPATSSLQVGGTVQLSAVTRDANSNVLIGRVVTWSSANPSIASVNSTSGLVTAVAAGSATITATSETKTGTAAITVSAPAPVPVATVTVSPASSSVQVGRTLQLSATTRDASGNVLTGRVVRWSSANTSIALVDSISGLFTAVAVGPVTITATSETKTGTGAFTGTTALPGPVWRGNEPAGMTTISDQSFATLPSSGWTLFGGAMLQSDNSGPQSPGSALVVPWSAGTAGGNGVGSAYNPLTGTINTLYMCVWLKFSSNWQGGNDLVNKIGFFYTPSGGPLVFEGYGAGSGPLLVNASIQAYGTNTNFVDTRVSGAHFTRGQWDLLEVVARANTAGNHDGSVDMYLNGVWVTSGTGIQWTQGATNWTQVTLDPIWSWPGETVVSNMDIRFDHVYLSRK
jgi:trimeric autotransporter adhesin